MRASLHRYKALGGRLARRALAATIVLVMGVAQTVPLARAGQALNLLSCIAAYQQDRQRPTPPPAPSTATVRTSDMTAAPAAPTVLWQDQFTALDLASPAKPHATWRPNDVWQPLDRGYTDFGAGGSTYNLNPAAGHGNPFSVIKDKDATDGTALKISSQRMTSEQHSATGVNCPWAGGFLVTNSDLHAFGYGYYDFRMKISHWGKGGFPALWLYAASGQSGNASQYNKGGAEVDLLEIFGYPDASPWNTTLHSATNNNGPSAIGDQGVATTHDDTKAYHSYGIDWTYDHLDFYKDDKKVGSASQAFVAWMRGLKMDIRLNVAMDASWFPGGQRSDSSTDGVDMVVDYVKFWSAKPSSTVPVVTPPVVVPPVAVPPVVKPPATNYNDQTVNLPLVGAAAPRPAASDHICDAVAALLTVRGYTTTADGTWSAQHTAQVKLFQASKGLAVDGLVGANTWARLLYS